MNSEVIYKNQIISSWYDYINLKFNDSKYFEIQITDTYGSHTIKSKTNAFTIFKSGKMLDDCQFYNNDCKGIMRDTIIDPYKYGTFIQENLNSIDELLDTPIYNGWTSIEYYLSNKNFKSILYDYKNSNKPLVTIYNNGCISSIIFPIFMLINILLNKGHIGNKIEVKIDPIIKNNIL